MLSALARLVARLHAAVRADALDRDLDEELSSHAAMLEDDYRRRGLTGEEARREARLRLGGRAQIREAHRDARGLPRLETAARDLRAAVRALRRTPGFATVAIFVLAIGIGANTAMFSVVHGVLLQPLAYPEPGRLMSVARGTPGQDASRWISLRRLESLRAAAQSFEGIGAYCAAREQVALSGDGAPEALTAARVSANFLDILGVRPALGCGFLPEEDVAGGPPVAMIGMDLWRRRFAADPAIAGRTVTIDAQAFTIVGVLPDGFRFPFSDVEVWLPQPALSATVPAQYHACCSPLIAFARLKPGVDAAHAEAELAVLSDRYAEANPGARNLDAGLLTLTPLKDDLTADVGSMLWTIVAAVVFVLLVGCVNIATLLMARASSRSREFAVRAALGASRGRLTAHLVVEGLVLAVCGGLLGLLLARVALDALTGMTLMELPRSHEIRLSGLALGFTAVVSMATGVFFGVLPAVETLRRDLMDRLRPGTAVTPAAAPGIRAHGARNALVVVQVALSIVLLVGAALMMQTLSRLAGVELGFQPEGLMTMRLGLATAQYDTAEKRAAMFDETVRRVESIPGVTGVALVRSLPRTGGLATNVQIAGEEIPEPGHIGITLQTIGPGAMRLLGVSMIRGRELTARDDSAGAPPVAIVNESFARRVWPGYPDSVDPVGRRLRVPILENQVFDIVGVAADVRQGGPSSPAPPQFYLPTAWYPPQAAYLAVRSRTDPLALVDAIRGEVLAVDPDQAVGEVRMMRDVIDASIGRQHVAARLMTLFAAAALLLVVVGIYGMLAYSVVQRTPEIGVRRAFGAQRRDILRTVVGRSLRLTLAGVACGLVGAAAFTRLMESLLFGVSATDPLTFTAVAAIFVLVAALATLVPAWRAAAIDPMTALRV